MVPKDARCGRLRLQDVDGGRGGALRGGTLGVTFGLSQALPVREAGFDGQQLRGGALRGGPSGDGAFDRQELVEYRWEEAELEKTSEGVQ